MPKKLLNIKGRLLPLEVPMVMGILNVTPDSFFDGGKYQNDHSILKKAEQILTDGASIIDIGGYSSRPSSIDIDIEEELKRVKNGIKLVSDNFPEAVISVDTFRAEVAKAAVDEGASMINDISGGNLDPYMFDFVAKAKVPYVLMHMKGTPQTMKNLTQYENLIPEILFYFQDKLKHLHLLGVKDIIIDPGFGFAKSLTQNYEILKSLPDFQILDCPVMVGFSRKSMISKKLDVTTDNALNGTSVLNTVALEKGASILRVHDVKEAVEVVKLYKAVNIN